MLVIIGAIIAAALGLTGIGGGSFTAPALVLLMGMPGGEAIGTAMVFTAVVRSIAAPFYIAGRNIHRVYLRLLLLGAIPGLLVGIFLLRLLGAETNSPVLLIILGAILVLSSGFSLLGWLRRSGVATRGGRWLPWLAFPIGCETGFSSAGAGALGTVVLLNFSEMTAQQIVGTDLLFGIVLALIGGAFHLSWGHVNGAALGLLLAGGVPGVLLGCALARKVPARRLRTALAVIAIAMGLQLLWSGTRNFVARTVALHPGQHNSHAVNVQVAGSTRTGKIPFRPSPHADGVWQNDNLSLRH